MLTLLELKVKKKGLKKKKGWLSMRDWRTQSRLPNVLGNRVQTYVFFSPAWITSLTLFLGVLIFASKS